MIIKLVSLYWISNFQYIVTYMFVRVQHYMRSMMSFSDKILPTYKGHMVLVKQYLFKKFHELLFLLLIIEV